MVSFPPSKLDINLDENTILNQAIPAWFLFPPSHLDINLDKNTILNQAIPAWFLPRLVNLTSI